MSLLSKPARPIAPESARLLREAMRARRKGFRNVADELAARSFATKLNEPTIWRKEDREAMADLKTSLTNVEAQKNQENTEQQIADRIAFADELKQKAAQGEENVYDYAKQEAPKYGVSVGALANFFQRNKMPYKTSKIKKASSV